MIDEKWLKGEVTVSRDRFADIISQEMETIKRATFKVNPSMWPLLEEFLVHYSANVASELFMPTTLEEEKMDKERER